MAKEGHEEIKAHNTHPYSHITPLATFDGLNKLDKPIVRASHGYNFSLLNVSPHITIMP